jgi:hypothetical protein
MHRCGHASFIVCQYGRPSPKADQSEMAMQIRLYSRERERERERGKKCTVPMNRGDTKIYGV